MKNRRWILIIALVAAAILVLSACSSAGSEQAAADDDHAEEEEAHIDPPAEYADLENPFAGDHEAAEAGAEIYEINCASCHGPEGLGDGPAAEGLDPKPASLADAHLMEDMSDGALFWRVSEGGTFAPFNSAMPPWKDVLSEDERWQVITFIREFAEDDHD
jgi:mono/diheme cytochrome c family protein